MKATSFTSATTSSASHIARTSRRLMRFAALALLVAACSDDPVTPMQDDRVLVYTRALGARHDEALAAATTALPARLAMEKVSADFTEDPLQFTEENLERYRAVIFLYTSGD